MANAAGYITDVSYVPGFYPSMAPVLLRYVATLNRIAPPPAKGYRYLELGCGLGRVFTTLAAADPGGEFIGVDVNPRHTAVAERDIAAGGLSNARVITADFASMPDDVGPCSFIAIHGVYSWVAEEVREQIRTVVDKHLAPGGLLLVSYNAMPGWAHLQPIRGILRQYAALRQGDSVQRIRDAVSYLIYIRDKQARYFTDNPRAAAYVDALKALDVRYLAHEYLNDHWTSFYFADVAGAMRGIGLDYVGSLPIHTNFWDLCVLPEFQELFRTTSDRLVSEAHKDFCANTAFRWDVYGRRPAPLPSVGDRLANADDLCYGLARIDATLPHESNLGIVTSTTKGPLYDTLVDLLRGGGRHLSDIVMALRPTGIADEGIVRAVDAGVATGLLEVTMHPVPASVPLSGEAVPRISLPFNRSLLATDLLAGRPVALASPVTGTGCVLGDLDAAFIHELVVGGRDGLVERVAARMTAVGRSFERDRQPVTDAGERQAILARAAAAVEGTLVPQLLRLGILEG
ncbi:MAG: methyltransferase regulatory domain-containing protein [Planctomycetaceae bacterium]